MAGDCQRSGRSKGIGAVLAACVLALLSACASDASVAGDPDVGGNPSTDVSAAYDGGGEVDRCLLAVAGGIGGEYPETIADAVGLINSLPRPVSLPCFLTSLGGPLRLNATDSPFSAQPAEGAENPRIFLMHPSLIMSVTLGTDGRELLEFGEMQTDGLTLKAELSFPIEETLSASAPFERIRFDGQLTGCGVCHALEREAGLVDGVMTYASQPLRTADHAIVSLEQVAAMQLDCDQTADPERCALLDALFGDGEWSEEPFPRDFMTAFR